MNKENIQNSKKTKNLYAQHCEQNEILKKKTIFFFEEVFFETNKRKLLQMHYSCTSL